MPSVRFLLLAVLLCGARSAGADERPAPGAPAASSPAATPPVAGAATAKVLAAVSTAARENAARPAKDRVAGDALFDLYVRRASAAAEGDVPSLLLGLAKAIDPADTLGRFPLTARAMRGLETEAEATARRAAIGTPTLRGRDDRALHFVVSAALAAKLGEGAANAAGLAKELADMKSDERLSVGDLLADAGGVVFARRMRAGDPVANLAWAAASFGGADVVPDDAGLPDALSTDEFEKAFGGPADPRFLRLRERLFASVDALPYLKPAGGAGGAGGETPPPAPRPAESRPAK